jgi:hypothetical protein
MNWEKIKTIAAIVFGIGVFIGCMAAWDWYHQQSKSAQKDYVTTAPVPAAKKIKKVIIPVKKIIALEKKAVSKRLKLPEAIASDDLKQVIATAQLPETETTGLTDIVAVLDTDKGTTELLTKQQPLSFFGFENKKAIGVRYGISAGTTSLSREADIYGRWDVLRTGAVRWGLYGEVNSRGDGKAMISAEYRF